MDQAARLSSRERSQLFQETAAKKNMTPPISLKKTLGFVGH